MAKSPQSTTPVCWVTSGVIYSVTDGWGGGGFGGTPCVARWEAHMGTDTTGQNNVYHKVNGHMKEDHVDPRNMCKGLRPNDLVVKWPIILQINR